jgi:hypothetical protein
VALNAFNTFSLTPGVLANELPAITRAQANKSTFFMALLFKLND